MTERLPLHLISGFLGSGKTTLLQRMLGAPALGDSAVLVNELGEIGLDHHLLRHIDGETVLLRNGCVCCTVRDDLGAALKDLLSRRARGEIPGFSRVIVESTGLADPVPILSTIAAEPSLRHHVRIGRVITTVDAVNAGLQSRQQPEFASQIAVADRIVLTKTDIADAGTIAAAMAQLRLINPGAAIDRAMAPDLDVADLLAEPQTSAALSAEASAWTRPSARFQAVAAHDAGVQSFCMVFDRPIDWVTLGIWLTMLLHAHGERVLRVKGLLDIAGSDYPVVINGVQHVMHKPLHLDAWPDEDHRSRLVFILRDLPRDLVERSCLAFLGLVPAYA
ncbi:GTP-binding protein [Acidisoma cellulosilytica]|uniref:GTP-binding protein n=1 Tax=Acidisoma cellulosilyticum TaxID=2802395 RepID=A0A963Z1Y5_9PROT|nr:GTP-binding protein [Acidisoma cellulosilyticum]MCB8881290.1 GTP-binding protein [Acidisoma cellulosilyticum]